MTGFHVFAGFVAIGLPYTRHLIELEWRKKMVGRHD